jgi:hypothetical protein
MLDGPAFFKSLPPDHGSLGCYHGGHGKEKNIVSFSVSSVYSVFKALKTPSTNGGDELNQESHPV